MIGYLGNARAVERDGESTTAPSPVVTPFHLYQGCIDDLLPQLETIQTCAAKGYSYDIFPVPGLHNMNWK